VLTIFESAESAETAESVEFVETAESAGFVETAESAGFVETAESANGDASDSDGDASDSDGDASDSDGDASDSDGGASDTGISTAADTVAASAPMGAVPVTCEPVSGFDTGSDPGSDADVSSVSFATFAAPLVRLRIASSRQSILASDEVFKLHAAICSFSSAPETLRANASSTPDTRDLALMPDIRFLLSRSTLL